VTNWALAEKLVFLMSRNKPNAAHKKQTIKQKRKKAICHFSSAIADSKRKGKEASTSSLLTSAACLR